MPAKDRLRRRYVAERKVLRQRRRIELRGHPRQREHRLGFAGEDETPPVVPQVERLDAEPIAADQQALAAASQSAKANMPFKSLDEASPCSSYR